MWRLLNKLAIKKITDIGYVEDKIDPDNHVLIKFDKRKSMTIIDSAVVSRKANNMFCFKKYRTIYKSNNEGKRRAVKTPISFEADEMIWFAIVLKNLKSCILKNETR